MLDMQVMHIGLFSSVCGLPFLQLVNCSHDMIGLSFLCTNKLPDISALTSTNPFNSKVMTSRNFTSTENRA